MVLSSPRRSVLRLASAVAGSCAVGFLLPILGMGLCTMGGSNMSDRFLQTLAISAVCLAVTTHFVLGGTRRLGAVLTHLIGIGGGLLIPLVLDTAWPRVARERAEFAASYAPRIVPGALRTETSFAVIWLSVTVAVALSFFLSEILRRWSQKKNASTHLAAEP